MKNWNHNQLRTKWFEYWEKKRGHLRKNSTPLISSDESLLWINSGVAGLKDIFTSPTPPPNPRLCNIQKAVRTDDLSLIGKTNRHLSFFEMMGNFSLGDYGKKAAITWAWEFLTSPDWLNLDKKKIYLTLFKEDQESISICQKDLKISPNHLFLKGLKTNFWDLGVGPCGPNLEFFYDLGPDFEADQKKQETLLLQNDQENDRYLEIWNIVFSEMFNSQGTGFILPSLVDDHKKTIYSGLNKRLYVNLLRKNIDTGMGLERILTILEGKKNPFETELFRPIIQEVENDKRCSFTFVAGKLDHQLDSQQAIINRRFKIIADHLRAIAFMLTDLLQLSKGWNFQNKHGYVIRQIIRNASLQGYFLGIKQPFLYSNQLIKKIVEQMGDHYPNLEDEFALEESFTTDDVPFLNQRINRLSHTIYKEEKKFLDLILQSKVSQQFLHSSRNHIWTGKEIFKIVSESGLPFSFLQTIAQEKNNPFGPTEIEQYEKAVFEHKLKSTKQKNTWIQKEDIFTSREHPATDFIEDKTQLANAKVLALFPSILSPDIVIDQEITEMTLPDALSIGEEGWVIFDKTPFYARKGGQEPDVGKITSDNVEGVVSNVISNQLFQYVHFVKIKKGQLSVGDTLNLEIDAQRRKLAANNHSATHLLHGILREIIGQDVQQNGSLNNDKYLRLDFFSRRSKDQIYFALHRVEKTFLNKIRENIPSVIRWVTPEEAKKEGALDFFDVGRYFAKKQRIVQFGDFSKELCGGTHVQKTGDIGNFVITDFKSIGQNIYRIYAYTYKNADHIVKKQLQDFQQRLDLKSKVINLFFETTYPQLTSEDPNVNYLKRSLQWEFSFQQHKDLMNLPTSEIIYFYKKQLFKKIFAKFKVFKKKTIANNLDILTNCYQLSTPLNPNTLFAHQIDLIKNVDEKNIFNQNKPESWIYPFTPKNLLNDPNFDLWLFLRKIFDKLKIKLSYLFLYAKWSENTWIFIAKLHKKSVFDWESFFNNSSLKRYFIGLTLKEDKLTGITKTSPIFLKQQIEDQLKIVNASKTTS